MGEDDFGHISLWAKHPDGRLEKVGLGTCNTLQMPEEIEEGNSSEKYSTDHAPTNITFTLKKINRFKILKLFRGNRIPRKVKKRKNIIYHE